MMVQFSCYGLNKLVPFYIKLQREGVGTPLAKLLYYCKDIYFLCQYDLFFYTIKVIDRKSYLKYLSLVIDTSIYISRYYSYKNMTSSILCNCFWVFVKPNCLVQTKEIMYTMENEKIFPHKVTSIVFAFDRFRLYEKYAIYV